MINEYLILHKKKTLEDGILNISKKYKKKIYHKL